MHGTMPLRLGIRDLNRFLIGAPDGVAIYPRMLKAAQILDHYDTGMAC